MKRKNEIAGMIAGAFALALGLDAAAVPVYGITGANNLIRFDSATPGTTTAPIAITGLGAGESILGIDFRPANGVLYGLGSGSRLYSINLSTGAATQVGADGAFALSGSSFGFDFNPVPDRIRVTSEANQNLRLNPNNGALGATDGALAFAAGDANAGSDPNIVGSAYTNSSLPSPRTPPPGTTLYGIDFVLDILVIQNPPNDGTLNTVGALGIDTGDQVGFDILATGNQGFASLTDARGISSLYTIDLATGAATLIGGIGSGAVISAIAVQAVPAPGALGLLAVGLAAMWGLRRRIA